MFLRNIASSPSLANFFAIDLKINNPILKKVMGIVLALFAVGFCVRAAYRFFTRVTYPPTRPYPAICQQARRFTESKLKEHKQDASFLNCQTYQEICTPIEMMFKSSFMTNIVRCDKHQILQDPRSLKEMDEFMKIAYTTATLFLEVAQKEAKKQNCSLLDEMEEKVFMRNAALMYDASYMNSFLVETYNLIRLGYGKYDGSAEFSSKPLTDDLNAAFYEEGHCYNDWRIMYNDLCDRVDTLFPLSEREKKFNGEKLPLLFRASKDMSKETFKPRLLSQNG